MDKLPVFVTTYKRTFNLYVNSYINVLPFLLVGAIGEYVIFKFFPITPNAGSQWGSFLEFILNTLIYVFVVYGVYVSHQGQKFNLAQVMTQALKRFFPLLCALIMLILPMILFGIALAVVLGLTGASQAAIRAHYMPIILVVTGIFYVVYCLIMVYFWPSSLLIIAKNLGPISGLKASWRLVRGYWLSTFFILLLYIIIVVGLYLLLNLFVPPLWLKPLISLLFTSFGASLMVIYVEHLEQVNGPNLIGTTKL